MQLWSSNGQCCKGADVWHADHMENYKPIMAGTEDQSPNAQSCASTDVETASLSRTSLSNSRSSRDIADIHANYKVEFHKACWKAMTAVGQRSHLSTLFPATVCYYDAEAHPGVMHSLALTIDDAPCSQREAGKSMVSEVQKLLREFNAKATFFLCTDFVDGYEEALVELVQDGHEVANHCPADRSYANDRVEDFEASLLQAENVCDNIRQQANVTAPGAVRWFRAPHAKVSAAMRQVINRHGFSHVLTDCYANDPWITDPSFIAETMVLRATHGSIAVLHMPEKGFREYNLQALREFLAGVTARGFRVITLSNLHQAASTSYPRSMRREPPEKRAGFSRACEASCLAREEKKVQEDTKTLVRSQKLRITFHRACHTAISFVGHRRHLDLFFPNALCYYDMCLYPGVGGLIALTVDHTTGCQRQEAASVIMKVRNVLVEHDARATFFLGADSVAGHEVAFADLLRDGHEIANSCIEDRSYAEDTEEEFQAALLSAESACDNLRNLGTRTHTAPAADTSKAEGHRAESDGSSCGSISGQSFGWTEDCPFRWFRAPHAEMSSPMSQVLNRHGFRHVQSDCYAYDPWISDPDFIADMMLSRATDGSIAAISMPQKDTDYNLVALEKFLAGAAHRGFRIVTLGSLHQAAYAQREPPDT